MRAGSGDERAARQSTIYRRDMDTPPSDTDGELVWEELDEQPLNLPVRRRVLRLLGAATIGVTILALLGVGIVLFAQRTYDHLPVDGFFKHDNPRALLTIAESVPVPGGLKVEDKSPTQGYGDAPSDGTVTYSDPENRANLCSLAQQVLQAAHWQPYEQDPYEFTATSPSPTSPKDVQITLTCDYLGLTVEVDGA